MLNRKLILEQMEAVMVPHQIPSASVAVYDNGSYSTYIVGLKNREQPLAPDPDTMYSIGSCSKSFTAAAIAILCDRKILNLDTPVKEYIPEFDLYDPAAGAGLTIRDMLCHRCGLARHELSWYARMGEYDEAQMLNLMKHLKPNQPFRYKMQYQNLMYALAGFVIHRVTGLSWENFLEKEITVPLGLGKISYDAPEFETMPNRAQGYRFFSDINDFRAVKDAPLNTICAAGSLSMSPTQLLHFDVLLMNGGKLGDKQIISPELCKELICPQMLNTDPIAEPLRDYLTGQSYGMGWFVDTYRGYQVLQHGGHIDGFISHQCFVPEKNFACVVHTNAESPFGANAIRLMLLDAALDVEQPVNWCKRLKDYNDELIAAVVEQPKPVSDPKAPCPVPLEAICGTYEDSGYGLITISLKEKILEIELGCFRMAAAHCKNQYFIVTEEQLIPGVQLEAVVDINFKGEVTGFSIGLEPLLAEKVHFIKK